MENIIIPRHYTRFYMHETRRIFDDLVKKACEISNSNYLKNIQFYIYLNAYDIRQEAIIQENEVVRRMLNRLVEKMELINEKEPYLFRIIRDNELNVRSVVFAVIPILPGELNIITVYEFFYNLLLLLQDTGLFSNYLTNTELKEIATEVTSY